jgi:hypothetical protein
MRTNLARPKGFEPLTPRFVVWCSIQLSYGRLVPPPGRARDTERPCSYRFRDLMARDMDPGSRAKACPGLDLGALGRDDKTRGRSKIGRTPQERSPARPSRAWQPGQCDQGAGKEPSGTDGERHLHAGEKSLRVLGRLADMGAEH